MAEINLIKNLKARISVRVPLENLIVKTMIRKVLVVIVAIIIMIIIIMNMNIIKITIIIMMMVIKIMVITITKSFFIIIMIKTCD